jgi:hypothetical protein
VLAVSVLFIVSLVFAAVVHLNLAVTRRLINRALTQYLDEQLVGSFDLGRIERLDSSTIWFSGLAVYDAQHRRVLTVNHLRAKTRTFRALYDWLTGNDKLTIVIESVWADGVNGRFLTATTSAAPTLAQAFELDPTHVRPRSTSKGRPYRIALSDVVISDTKIENQLTSLPFQTAQFKRLAGLVLITPDGVAVSLKRFGMQLTALSNLGLQGTGTLDFRSPNRIWGEVSATLGSLPLTVRVDYRDEQLNLNLDAPKITPEQGRTVYPSWPLRKPASLSLVTFGPLSALATRLSTTVENSKLDILGTTFVSANPSGSYSLSGNHVDLSALFGAAVSSDLDLRARAEFHVTGNTPEVKFEGLVDSGFLLNHKTPSLDFEGKLDNSGLILGVRSHDVTLPLRAGLWMHDGRIELDAQTQNVSLAPLLLPFEVRDVSGYVSLRARGVVTDERISVEAHSTVTQAKVAQLEAGTLTVDTNFEGPKNEPLLWQGQAQLTAKDLRSPYFNYPTLHASLRGSPRRSNVTAVAEDDQHTHLTLDTELYIDQPVELRAATLGLGRGEHQLKLQVKHAVLGEKAVVVQGLALGGSAGDLKGEVAWQSDGELSAKLTSERLELSVLNDLLGLPPQYLAGTASASLDLESRGGSPHGHMLVTFKEATAFTLTKVTGTWEQTLRQKNLQGTVEIHASLVDRIHGSYDLSLGGPVTEKQSYVRAAGNARVEFERFQLDRLTQLLGPLPPSLTTRGTVSARITATRSTVEQLPDVLLSVTTDGLGLDLVREGGKHLTFERSELLGNVDYEGTTGSLTSDWVLSKAQQPTLVLGIKSRVNLVELFADPLLTRSKLYDLPFDAGLTLPRQSLSEVETILGEPLGSGTVQSKLWLKGPLTDPHLVVEFDGEQLSLKALDNPVPLDTHAVAEFAHQNGETRIMCGIGSNNQVWAQLNAVGSVFANPDAVRQPSTSPYDWSGKLELGFTELPLDAIPWLQGSQVSGFLRGGATVTRIAGMTTLNALVPIADLKIQSRPIGQSLLSLSSDERELVAAAKLIDGGAQVDFEAHVPVELNRPLPALRTSAPLLLSAQAAGYDAGILAPFLDPYLGQIQGELSGDLEATYYPTTKTTAVNIAPKLALGGKVQLRHGRGRLRALGVNVTDISIDAQASSTGSRTLIHIPLVKAALGATVPNLEGTVVVELQQLELKRLGASVTRAEAVPLILDGVTQAKLTGTATLEIVPILPESSAPSTEGGYLIDATVGELEVNLPREMAREVVALAENKDISVLQPLGSAAYQKTQPTALTPYRIRLNLGRKTRVTRNDFSFPVSGNPSLLLQNKLYTAGNIQLEPGGRLQLAGKTFVIERGQVTLNPDEPSNPRFEVEAQWRGPTHTVIATVSGTRKEAELHLTSDPPLGSESQVFALLLSGSGTEVDSTTAGLGVGATLFNEFMSETPLSAVELRTSQDEQHANYTAAVPLKENLWFEGTYQNATNNGLRPNSSSAREGFSGTVDWRFRRNWSLRTEVGTLGAGADILWQYRY